MRIIRHVSIPWKLAQTFPVGGRTAVRAQTFALISCSCLCSALCSTGVRNITMCSTDNCCINTVAKPFNRRVKTSIYFSFKFHDRPVFFKLAKIYPSWNFKFVNSEERKKELFAKKKKVLSSKRTLSLKYLFLDESEQAKNWLQKKRGRARIRAAEIEY